MFIISDLVSGGFVSVVVHLNNHRYAREFMQVDGGDSVLWPQGRTVKSMYDTEFRAWLCGQQGLGPEDTPCEFVNLSQSEKGRSIQVYQVKE